MLNYHHLRIFRAVAREGSLRAASERLHLTQPTMSTQIHQLEDALGEPLFLRSGRRLILTAAGRLALEYAEEIFSLGDQMQAAFAQGVGEGPRRLHVGIVNSLPKLVARELLGPVFVMESRPRVICHEGLIEDLAVRLTQHRLDLLLADEPLSGETKLTAFNHRLGACGVTLCGTENLAARHRRGFPESLNGAPLLLPAAVMPLRRSLDAWLLEKNIQPHIVAEFDDTALLKDFAADGLGLAPIHQAALAQARNLYHLVPVGEVRGLSAEFYAITAERTLRNPFVRAITNGAFRKGIKSR